MHLRAEEAEAVHALPEHDSGTGVRLDDVHHAPEALGDRHAPAPHRAPGQGLVPEPAHEEQEAERAIKADDAVVRRRRRLLPAPTDQGGTAVPASGVHHLAESPGRRCRRPKPDSPRPVRDVIAARGSPGLPHDVMPAAAAASFPAATATAAAAAAAVPR